VLLLVLVQLPCGFGKGVNLLFNALWLRVSDATSCVEVALLLPGLPQSNC
jgi:hypothetical protein